MATFISRGRTLRIVDAYKEPLGELLSSLSGQKFTGRLDYRGPDVRIQLEMLGGRPVACIASDERGNWYYGDECAELAMKYLDRRQGFTEIIELDNLKVSIDLDTVPQARLSEGKARELLEAARGKPAAPPTAPAAAPKPEARPAAPTAPKPPARPSAPSELRFGSTVLPEWTVIVEEGIPVSKMIEAVTKADEARSLPVDKYESCLAAVEEAMRKAGRGGMVYLVCTAEDGTVYRFLMAEEGKLWAVAEKGGEFRTGREVLEEAAKAKPTAIRLYLRRERK